MDESRPKTRSVSYYRTILIKGNGNQWRELLERCKADYDLAFQVAKAVASLDPEIFKSMQTLWRTAIETAQPGIDIKLGKELDEDLKVRKLKQQRYSDTAG